MPNQFLPDAVYNLRGEALGKFHDLLAGLERGVTRGLGINEILDYASRRPQELGYTDDHRGRGDALRHILLAAELQRTHPHLAKPLLYGHEFLTNTLQGQLTEEREQDLENNRIGLQLGQLARSRPEVERLALKGLPKAKILPAPEFYTRY